MKVEEKEYASAMFNDSVVKKFLSFSGFGENLSKWKIEYKKQLDKNRLYE
jgi:hypothetical protein